MTRRGWSVHLSAVAHTDFDEIIRWTTLRFGADQARAYSKTLASALDELRDGPSAVGVKSRNDIDAGLYSLHVARKQRRGRHVILFRLDRTARGPTVEVVRILHDSMEPSRHVSRDEQ